MWDGSLGKEGRKEDWDARSASEFLLSWKVARRMW